MAATSAVPQVLVAQQLANSETTQYTTAASTTVKIASATLANTSGAAVTVSVSVVKSGGTASVSNRVLSAWPLAAGDSVVLKELAEHVLGTGDFISAIATTAAAVSLVLSGIVFS
jgi:hypothetical protein